LFLSLEMWEPRGQGRDLVCFVHYLSPEHGTVPGTQQVPNKC
jgi:hypothetical protein